jgi:2-dehydropantoate 2-reductase
MEPIHIVGAGGIGCAVGYALRANGAPVTLVDADPGKLAWGQAHGVAVNQLPSVPAEFMAFKGWSPPAGARILLCTKCYDNEAVLARIASIKTTLIPIQNGFDRALANQGEGIASFVSECIPGRTQTRITRAGKLHLGYRRPAEQVDDAERKRIEEVFAALERAVAASPLPIRVVRVPQILPYKYTKLMYNAAVSPLAASAGLDNGKLLSLPDARRLFFALIRENYNILHGANIALGKIGPFHPDTVQKILRRPLVARALAWAFYPSLKGTYCSMSGDLPKGKTEIEYYNGHLLDLAGAVPCPVNRQVYELVKRMEHERIPPGREVLRSLFVGHVSNVPEGAAT